MSSRDISEAMAYDRIQPFGDYRQDLGYAMVASTIANCHRSSNSKPFKLSDFVLNFDEVKEKNLNDQIKEAFNFGQDTSSISY